MAVPTDMDGFSDKIGTTDTCTRLSLGDALLNYLGNNLNSIECSDIGQFIDKLVPWLTCSNFKVSQKGLEIMTALVERMKNDFKPYVPTVCPAIVDRLGDSHESVRDKTQALLMIFLDKDVLTPQQLFDRVGPAFSHKNSKVREEIMVCLVNTINMYGSNSIALSKLTPHLVKLLADQNVHVREQAFNTLIEIYRRVGDRLRIDIQRRYASTINPSRLAPLMAKMEELQESGALMTSSEGRYEDETDRPIEKTVVKKLHSVKKPPTAPLSSTPLGPGAVDEEFFANAFEDVPTVQIFSAHELKEVMISIANTIGNPDMDWDKRVDAFRRIRSLLIAGAANFEDFFELMKKWELPFIESLKDLRSHVVRETCVTIAYLAQTLGIKFARFAEVVFQNLISLIQSSAKVIASAGYTSIRFIIQNVHNQRLLPIINNNMTSRSREIRKVMCDVLDQLIHTWPLAILDKRIPLLQEAVKRGVSDADMEARISARRAFWAFKGYFPEQADALLATLDYSYKKSLYGDVSLSGSNQSLNQGLVSRQTSRTRIPSSAADRSLSLGSGNSPSIITSISKEDYFLNTSSCLLDINKDLQKFRSVTSLKGTSDSSLFEKFYCLKTRKRRERKRPGVCENEKHGYFDTEMKSWAFTDFFCNSPRESTESSFIDTPKQFKPKVYKKSRESNFLCNRILYLNKSLPSLQSGEGIPRSQCLTSNDTKANLSNDKDFHAVFSTLSSLILFEDPALQKNLKKSEKIVNKKGIPGTMPFSPFDISVGITGNRRMDKIKIFHGFKSRFADMKDEETMTDLTAYQEEQSDVKTALGVYCKLMGPSGLKKTPKTLNLNRMLEENLSLLQGEGNDHRRMLHTFLKRWRSPGKLETPESTSSHKSLVFIFKNKGCFGGSESLGNSPQETEGKLTKLPLRTNFTEKKGRCDDEEEERLDKIPQIVVNDSKEKAIKPPNQPKKMNRKKKEKEEKDSNLKASSNQSAVSRTLQEPKIFSAKLLEPSKKIQPIKKDENLKPKRPRLKSLNKSTWKDLKSQNNRKTR